MYRLSRKLRCGRAESVRTAVLAVLTMLMVGSVRSAAAADTAGIQRSIDAGAKWLRSQFATLSDLGEISLTALALSKSGEPADSPIMAQTVAGIQKKIKDGKYQPVAHHAYEAGVDAMLLVELDGEKYKPELTAIRDWLLSAQRSTGGWTYGGSDIPGDTSVTQYACLALWAVSRAGIDVPIEVWDKVLRWHIQWQNQDGGFCYMPGLPGQSQESNLNMTMAAVGSVMIAARHAYPGRGESLQTLMGRPAAEDVPVRTDTDANPLVKVDLTVAPAPIDEPATPQVRPSTSTVGITSVQNVVTRGLGWLNPRFVPMRPLNDGFVHHLYYVYTTERTLSLTNQTRLGQYTWYDDGSSALIRMQKPDGSWSAGTAHTNEFRDTAFALLFLVRSTGKMLHRSLTDPKLGGGLLTGGKGEPAAVVAVKKDPTPLDQLLKSLQNPGALNIEEAQTDLLDQIQLGDRSELVGQKDLLVQLMRHPHGEVRRTACWALGRTNDLHLARYLIDALEDPDVGVMMEAHAGLCWLSRRFDGFGLPANPLGDLSESASEPERQTAIHGWRVRARRDWGNWYLRVRPYADRGDEFEAQLKQRMGEK